MKEFCKFPHQGVKTDVILHEFRGEAGGFTGNVPPLPLSLQSSTTPSLALLKSSPQYVEADVVRHAPLLVPRRGAAPAALQRGEAALEGGPLTCLGLGLGLGLRLGLGLGS